MKTCEIGILLLIISVVTCHPTQSHNKANGVVKRQTEEGQCEAGEIPCEGGECIPGSWRCDEEPDCPNGDDEGEFCVDCNVNQFYCYVSNTCTSGNKCDDVSDCPDGEDESNCPPPCSGYQCGSGQCISSHWECDGIVDCSDQSDEQDCPVTCPAGEVACSNGDCIPGSYICDNELDCVDGSDELENCAVCQDGEFYCYSDNICISGNEQCNGNNDCNGGEDELNCPGCATSEFECANGLCKPGSWQCDGMDDCGDGSDESNCGCASSEFECANGLCKPGSWQCDGMDDCGDGSDESNCGCAESEFECANGLCKPGSWECDGMDDCGDGSDESNCGCPSGTYECKTGPHDCIPSDWECDGVADCKDGADECGCDEGRKRQYKTSKLTKASNTKHHGETKRLSPFTAYRNIMTKSKHVNNKNSRSFKKFNGDFNSLKIKLQKGKYATAKKRKQQNNLQKTKQEYLKNLQKYRLDKKVKPYRTMGKQVKYYAKQKTQKKAEKVKKYSKENVNLKLPEQLEEIVKQLRRNDLHKFLKKDSKMKHTSMGKKSEKAALIKVQQMMKAYNSKATWNRKQHTTDKKSSMVNTENLRRP